MKTTILVLTALLIAAAPFARAQEEESSPSPSASPEMTPPEKSEPSPSDPSVSVTTEKTASPSPRAESSPAASTKAASPAPKSSPEAAPAKASSAATIPPRKSSPEATLKELENMWEASIPKHDSSVAQALLADDFLGVSSKGKLLNKSGLIAEIKKDTDTYTSAKNGRMDVRVFGKQFAVVRGTSTEIGKDKDGKPFNRTFRWTDTWVDRNGKWQCVASQAVAVSK